MSFQKYGKTTCPDSARIKPPLKPKHIWAIRTRLQHDGRVRDLAMFNAAIDSKLRGCDLVRLRVSDIHLGDSIRLRTTIVQQKTGRPVPFELTEPRRGKRSRRGFAPAAARGAIGCSLAGAAQAIT